MLHLDLHIFKKQVHPYYYVDYGPTKQKNILEFVFSLSGNGERKVGSFRVNEQLIIIRTSSLFYTKIEKF